MVPVFRHLFVCCFLFAVICSLLVVWLFAFLFGSKSFPKPAAPHRIGGIPLSPLPFLPTPPPAICRVLPFDLLHSVTVYKFRFRFRSGPILHRVYRYQSVFTNMGASPPPFFSSPYIVLFQNIIISSTSHQHLCCHHSHPYHLHVDIMPCSV